MPPKATIEEVFDDDTDLPLPPIPLPKQPMYDYEPEQVSSSRQSSSTPMNFPPGMGLGMGGGMGGFGGAPRVMSEQTQSGRGDNVVTDLTPYKKWTSIYPIYIDAKRPYGTGQRRISRPSSLWWPTSRDISQAAQAIGIKCLHEPNKSHPQDWENPGRVKVLWKKDGEVVFKRAKTRKQLIEMLSLAVQAAKPELKPSPDGAVDAHRVTGAPTSAGASSSTPKSKSKVKQSSGSGSTKSGKKTRRAKKRQTENKPPKPYPPLSTRISVYSPALEMGIVKETFKNGMDKGQLPGSEMFLGGGEGGMPGAGGEGGAPQAGSSGKGPVGGSGKGKRKVVRVRG